MKLNLDKKRIWDLCQENKWIIFILTLLFFERIIALFILGFRYNVNSDDISYLISGIEFAKSGTLTMHGTVSAQIMPGMTVLIAFFSSFLGDYSTNGLWIALKFSYLLMGVATAYYTFKTVRIFSPLWCALAAAAFYVLPDLVWMNNLILTETPFLMLFIMLLYNTIMLGKTKKNKYFYGCLITYMLALMFKANIAIYPLFAIVYLLLNKYNIIKLLKQGSILAVAVLCFIIPWSIRNYSLFDAFIPLTYGEGNPKLLGTYQGNNYPLDSELDYQTNVEDVAKIKLAKYYDENGNLKEPYFERYINLQKDGIKASYRNSVWWNTHPKAMLYSYLYYKPKLLLDNIFYWDTVFEINTDDIKTYQSCIYILSFFSVLSSFLLKKQRKEMFLLLSLFFVNIYIYAFTFAFGRYSATLKPLLFIAIGIGLPLIFELFRKAYNEIKTFKNPV